MQRKSYLLFGILTLLLLINGCNNDSNIAVINGDFSSVQSKNISFTTHDLLTLETVDYPGFKLDSINNLIQVSTKKPLFGTLNMDDISIPLYLENGFDLGISDFKGDNIAFTGKGARINNYLLEYKNIENKSFGLEPYTYHLSPKAFKARIDSLNTSLEKINSELLSSNEIKVVNQIKELKLVNYELQYLIGSHSKGSPIPQEQIPSWSKFERNNELFDMHFSEFGIYLHFILDVFFYNEQRKTDFNTEESAIQKFYGQVDKKIRNLKIQPELKEILIAKNLTWSFLMTGLTPTTKSDYNKFINDYPNSKCLKSLENTYARFRKLQKGKVIPDITCLSPEDSLVPISSLKGKVFFIDVWATWCTPCIKEFQYSKMLQKKYDENEVSFVYLSIDEDKNKWKAYLDKNKDLKGIHLIENEKKSVSEKLQIVEIPRYMIVDSKGIIIDADAPSPSSGKAEKLIDELLKKMKTDKAKRN